MGAALLSVSACIPSLMRAAVPGNLAQGATVSGYAPIRHWGDEPLSTMETMAGLSAGSHLDYLSLSGGGINGAYGAGYLVGWTARGDRPTFDVVTGISVGAIIAPFAFLGPQYDNRLKAAFDVLAHQPRPRPGFIAALLGAPSLASNKIVVDAIELVIDEHTLEAIGREHRAGRRLLVGTTNLDAERPVIWDIGAIANSGLPNRVALAREVILASTALPGIFPPALISVNADGKAFDELHVDGGVTQQVMLLPGGINSLPGLKGTKGRKAYVIFNGTLEPSREPVEVNSMSILARSIPTLLKYRGRSDIELLTSSLEASRSDYALTAIPASFPPSDSILGSPEWLDSLFAFGVASGQAGTWQRED